MSAQCGRLQERDVLSGWGKENREEGGRTALRGGVAERGTRAGSCPVMPSHWSLCFDRSARLFSRREAHMPTPHLNRIPRTATTRSVLLRLEGVVEISNLSPIRIHESQELDKHL